VRPTTGRHMLLWPAVVLLALGLTNAYLAFVHRESGPRFLCDAFFAVLGLAGFAVVTAFARGDGQQ